MEDSLDKRQDTWRDGQRPALRERLRGYLDTTDTLTGRLVNGAIVLLIFLSATIFVV
jgi:voltage-gated potassium channel